jgi:2-keto-4-pentenoate hydratase
MNTRDLMTVGWMIALAFAFATPALGQDDSEEAARHYAAYRDEGVLLDFVGAHEGATRADALAFQQAFTAEFLADGDEVVGYKLGFTGKAAPPGAEPPLAGRLFASQRVEAGAAFKLSELANPILEVELAFRFKSDVPAGADAETIRQSVEAVAGCIEIPNPAYQEKAAFHGLNFIAHNVVSRRFMVFDWVPLEEAGDVNELVALLTRPDGRQVVFNSSNVLPEREGHHWAALAFAVEELERVGGQIQAGHIVITGSMGYALSGATDDTGEEPEETLHIMTPGQYAIDFGSRLGRHVFEVRDE